jgi:hypothetical protein
MSRALRELGLGPDADERAVKRAYAAKLKTVRPDADAEGFQRLHAAYQQALEWVRERGEDAANVVALETPPAESSSEPIDGSEPQPHTVYTETLSAEALFERLNADDELQTVDRSFDPGGDEINVLVRPDGSQDNERFNLEDFLSDCAELAMNGRVGELLDWLNAQPFLWSLEHKAQVAHWLLRFLHEQRPPIEAGRFDVLADFFGLLDLNSGYDAYFIQHLRHRLQLAWETRTGQVRALAQRTGIDGGSLASTIRQVRRMLRQIKRPLNILQALIAASMPMYPTAVRRFIHRLDFGNLDDFPPEINPEQIAFWDAAGDRTRISKPRLQVGATRCVVYALIGMLGTLLVKAMTPDSVIELGIAWKSGAIMLLAMLQGWLMMLGGQACAQWQCLPEAEEGAEERFRWLRLALIPILALLAVALDQGLGLSDIAAFSSVVAFLLAWLRYHRRNGPLFGFVSRAPIWYGLILVAPVLALLDYAPHALIGGIAAIALLLWFLDLRKQRQAAKAEQETSTM